MASHGLTAVVSRVEAACRRVGRDAAGVRIVAVSKTASDDDVRSLHALGVRDFGENRAAALAERAARLPDDIRWHFIGRLQGNKVRRIRPVTTLLHSLDRPDLVDYWMKGPGRPPPVLVQVNVAGEAQKAGVAPQDVAAVVDRARAAGLEVVGLMTMAPLVDDTELTRPVFRTLANIKASIGGLDHLSMGMTDDFEVAVEEGATILRVGRAIFGTSRGG